MRYHFFLSWIIFILFSFSAYSQDKLPKLGECTIDELQLKQCSFDTAASAMVIFDAGTVNFDETGYIILERRVRYKIFNKAGFQHAEFAIPYSKKMQQVTSIKGYTYNLENGEIKTSQLNNKQVYEGKIVNNIAEKKFAMPDIKEGSVFEVTYSLLSRTYTMLPSWEFQLDVPVQYSIYDATIHPLVSFAHYIRGNKPLDDFKKAYSNRRPYYINNIARNSENIIYIMRDIPAFVNEGFITSDNDYKVRLDFQLTSILNKYGSPEPILSTWPKLCEELNDYEGFGDYIKDAENFAKSLYKTTNLQTMSHMQKYEWIDRYIKDNYTYDDDESFTASITVKKLNETKRGNSAELNLLAIGMLRAAGIPVDPVMLSTRDHGKIQTAYPFLDAFNYVTGLATIDSNLYLIDVTEPMLNKGEIPTRCLNEAGFVVKKDIDDWIEFESTLKSDIRHEIELSLLPSLDSLKSEVKISSVGYDALKLRKEYKNDYTSLTERYLGDHKTEIDSVRCQNLKTSTEPFVLNFTKKLEVEQVDGKLIINPCCGMVVSENPFKLPLRTYPIDFTYKFSKSFAVNIKIPEGYKALSVPENITINNKLARIVYVVNNSGDALNITGVYQFKKDVYPSEEYQSVKELYNIIVTKFNEKIILEPAQI